MIIYFVCCCDEKVYRPPLHLFLVYKHLFFLDPNWILFPNVVSLLSHTIWGQDCSYCPMKVISHHPLFHCNSVLQFSIGLLTAPIIAGHGGRGVMLVALCTQQWRTWAQNCTGTKEDENHLDDDYDYDDNNNNHNKLSIVEHQQEREYVSHHPIVQHTHELI